MPQLKGKAESAQRRAAPGGRRLLFSVDTEPDDPHWRGLQGDSWSHENLRGLPRLAEACRRLGVLPTFYVSHSTAVRIEAAGALLPLLRDGLCEVGPHLHPGDTPPLGPWDAEAGDNLLKVSTPMLEAKFAALHWEIWSRFGRPLSYRSAAWTLDARVVGLLERHGYLADSSVTPGVSWRLHGRPSYLDAPRSAYRLGYGDPCVPGESPVVEVPVSVWSPHPAGEGLGGRLLADLFTMPMASRRGPVAGLVRSVRPMPPQWIRPAFKSLAEMEAAARALEDEDYLHVMCHSNELWPGTSPYVRTGADLDAFYARLEGIFRFALARGYVPATVSGYAADWAGSDPGPRPGSRAPSHGGPGGTARPEPAPALSDRIPDEAPAAADAGIAAAAHEGDAVSAPPSRLRRSAVLAGKAAVSLAAFWIVLARTDWGSLSGYLHRIDATFVLACLAAMLLELALNAAKVADLLRPARVAAAEVLRVNTIKVLFNNLLPGGIGGEAARMLLLGRSAGSVGTAAAAVFADRLSGLWIQVMATAACLPFFAAAALSPGGRWAAAGGAAILAAALAWVITGPGPRLLDGFLRRLPGDAAARAAEVARYRAHWAALLRSPRRLLAAVAYGLAGQALLIVILCLAARALGGGIDPLQASPIILFAALSGLIPLSLGGLGIAEGAYALAFALAGSEAELGFLVSLLLRALGLPATLAGAGFFLRGSPWLAGGLRQRGLRSAAERLVPDSG